MLRFPHSILYSTTVTVYCVDFHSKLFDSNLICCARLSPLHLHSSFFPCLGIAASNHHHLSTRFKMLGSSSICHQRKEMFFFFFPFYIIVGPLVYIMIFTRLKIENIMSTNSPIFVCVLFIGRSMCGLSNHLLACCITGWRLKSPFLVVGCRVSDPIIQANKAQ